jgi:hypothetical protein
MRKLAGAVALIFTAGAGQAQDVLVYAGAELEFTHEEAGPGTGTITYLSGYGEVELAGFYGGLWGQVASDDLLNEVNLYFGYRNETAGGLAYTVYYTRYYYPMDGGDGGGEFALELDLPLGDQFAVAADAYYSPSFAGASSLASAYVGGSWYVTDALELSATFGTYEVDGASNEEEWDIGATYALGAATAVDFRYYDGSEYLDSYLGLSLTWDTTLVGG